MPGVGVEPTRPYDRQILSLLRIPIPPPGQINLHIYTITLRPRWESNPRITVLQTVDLPLVYVAILINLILAMILYVFGLIV